MTLQRLHTLHFTPLPLSLEPSSPVIPTLTACMSKLASVSSSWFSLHRHADSLLICLYEVYVTDAILSRALQE